MYLAGLAQGLSLVTFPAAGTILTSPAYYNFTSSEYGSLFIPMVACAILASMLSARLADRWGLKQVFVVGLIFNLTAMSLLALSQGFVARHDIAYGLLLGAMATLGSGFGTTLTALNTYAAGFFPGKSDVALPALHALLGTGTALAPLLVAIFLGLAVWWLLPVAVGGGFLLLVIVSVGQPLRVAPLRTGPRGRGGVADPPAVPPRLWVYAGIVILYGTCETIFGNWGPIYLHTEEGLSLYWANFALAAFWAMVTFGRVVVAAASAWVSARWIYATLPILILTALLGIPRIEGAVLNVMAFGFAGLGCSAFLPLSISFAGQEFPRLVEVVSGGLMAAYMLGYGIGSFGVAPLIETGRLHLSTIYAGSSALAAGMIILAFVLNTSWPVKVQPPP